MLVTELGMVMLVRPVHDLNALEPIEVTELGMLMLVMVVLSWNALFPIVVTGRPKIVLGITTDPPAPV